VGFGSLSVSASVSTTLSSGYSFTAGKNTQKSMADSFEAEIVVPPYSSINVSILGHIVKLNIPFTADMVTTYTDGSTRTKYVTGMYKSVESGHFRVSYSAAQIMKHVTHSTGSISTTQRTTQISRDVTTINTVTQPTENHGGRSNALMKIVNAGQNMYAEPVFRYFLAILLYSVYGV
jgi:hypothetical protein